VATTTHTHHGMFMLNPFWQTSTVVAVDKVQEWGGEWLGQTKAHPTKKLTFGSKVRLV
jgi:hypothetical protein